MNGTGRIGGTASTSLATLCLPSTATPHDVRRAFRSLMLQLHPDSSGSTGSGDQLTAVVDAYRNLSAAGFLDDRPGSGIRRNGQLVDIRA